MFNGTNANGIWGLYIFDDVGGDVGGNPLDGVCALPIRSCASVSSACVD